MARELIDLLWRDSPDAPSQGARGPRAKRSTDDVVDQAIGVADAGGLGAVTIRTLAQELGMTPMSIYTYVNTREDLLVLMADRVHAQLPVESFGGAGWHERAHRTAHDNLVVFRRHPWLLGIDDHRLALGPGTIAKYEHELHVFDGTGLDHFDRDAALTFLLDFVRASAARMLAPSTQSNFDDFWAQSSARLEQYLGTDFPLARTVGRAAGEAMGSPYDADRAWEFGLARVLAGLADVIHPGQNSA